MKVITFGSASCFNELEIHCLLCCKEPELKGVLKQGNSYLKGLLDLLMLMLSASLDLCQQPLFLQEMFPTC